MKTLLSDVRWIINSMNVLLSKSDTDDSITINKSILINVHVSLHIKYAPSEHGVETVEFKCMRSTTLGRMCVFDRLTFVRVVFLPYFSSSPFLCSILGFTSVLLVAFGNLFFYLNCFYNIFAFFFSFFSTINFTELTYK